jgi:DNA-binding NarL/FixJ family response regulator
MLRIGIISPVLAMRNGLESLLAERLQVERFRQGNSLEEIGFLNEIDVLIIAYEEHLELEDEALLADLENPPALLMLSDDASRASLAAELSFRSWGVLPLEASEDELVAAVTALAEGLIVASPLLIDNQMLVSSALVTESKEAFLEELTAREIEVLEALAQGLANKQIALALSITEHTVKFHSSAIYSKMGVTNRTEAVRKGVRLGLIAF